MLRLILLLWICFLSLETVADEADLLQIEMFAPSWQEEPLAVRKAKKEERAPLVQEGEIVSRVNGVVNVITGKSSGSELDYVLNGPFPLVAERCHDDRGYEYASLGGWHFLDDHFLRYYGEEDILLIAYEVTGDQIGYKCRGKRVYNEKHFISERHFGKGVVNSYSGEVGGSTNKKNQYVYMPSRAEAIVNEADGTKRKYILVDASRFTVREVILPTGHPITYERSSDKGKLFLTIKAWNPSKTKAFGSLGYEMTPGTNKRPAEIKISGSDGRSISYLMKNKEGQSFFEGVINRENFDASYEYDPDRKWVNKKKLQNGASFETYYYKDQHKFKDLPAQEKPINGYIRGNEGDRVYFQKAPVGTDNTPIVTHRYCYYKLNQKNRFDAGYTDVFDAYNHKTRYFYNKNRRLTSIERYNKDNTLNHSEHLEWDEHSKSQDYTNLRRRYWKDENQCVVQARTFEYDKQGNVTVERCYGNFSGTCHLSLPEIHNFIENAECLTKKCTYSDDDFHLKLSESIKEDLVTHFTYLSGTNLIKSQYIKVNGAIVERHFFGYDSDNLLVYKIIDDGSSLDEKDLSNLSERRVSRIQPKQNAPAMGMPEVIEELYYDLNSKKEVLLSRIENCYSTNNKIASQAIYDAKKELCYTLKYSYDDKGRLISSTDLLGNVTAFSYDILSNKVHEVHPNGVVKEFKYDFVNRVIETKENHPDGTSYTESNSYNYLHQKVGSKDFFGAEKTFEYDPFGNLLKEIGPKLLDEYPIIERKYNLFGKVIQETDPNGYSTSITYNAEGKPTSIHYPDGSFESFTYNLSGTLQKSVLKNGSIILFEYDERGREIERLLYDSNWHLCRHTSKRYNNFHLISETDAGGVTTHYSYDGAGRLIKGTTENLTLTYEYDARGELYKKTEWANDQDSISYITLRNPFGQIIEEREEANSILIRKVNTTYDSFGNKASTITYTDKPIVESYRYNSFNQVIEIIHPNDTSTHFHYDHHALQVTKTDPLGLKTITTHDHAGRVTSITSKNRLGEIISHHQMFYDLSNNKIQVLDDLYISTTKKSTHATRFIYGPLQQCVQEIMAYDTPEATSTSFEYDKSGNLKTTFKPDGSELHYEYDALMRLSHLFSSNHKELIDYTYCYNDKDLPISVEDKIKNTKTERSYDSLGYLLSETLANGFTLYYQFDPLGRCTSLTLPDASSIHSSYLGAHHTSLARLNAKKETLYIHLYKERDLSGHITLSETPIGPIHYQWNHFGKNSKIKSEHFEKTIDLYDLVGNPIKTTCHDFLGTKITTYTYDPLYQLSSESSDETFTYTHDSINNRHCCNDQQYSLNALNQIQTHTYDPCGNLLAKGADTYTYDALNRLTSVTSNAITTTYTYDGFNRRISKSTEDTSQYFIYTANHEIGSVDSSGTLKELRILGSGLGADIGSAIAFEIDNKTYIPIHDMQGSLALIIDLDSKQPLEAYHLNAFGTPLNYEKSPIPWIFSSKRLDPESNLIYFGRRFYDPSLGRWLTQDPNGFKDGPNLYAFVHNNPLSSLDLYGLATSGTEKNENTWDKIKDYLDKFFSQTRSTIGGIIHTIGRELPIPYIRQGIMAIGNLISHGSFRPANGDPIQERSRLITIKGHRSGNVISVSTGAGTSAEDAIKLGKAISESFGGAEVEVFYGSSYGIILDLIECLANIVGIPTRTEQVTAEGFKKCSIMAKERNVGNIHFYHSQGGLLTYSGMKKLSYAERQKYALIGFGSAFLIPKDCAGYVINHVNPFDPIPWIADFPGMITAHFGEGIPLHVEDSLIPLDHAIFGASYSELWHHYGAVFSGRNH